MKYLSIIIFITSPIFLFGQNRKIEICEKNGQIHHRQQIKINGKIRNYKLLNVTADSVFVINQRSQLMTFSLDKVQNPTLYTDDLTTYITVCTNNGDKLVGKLETETPENITINLGHNNLITIQKDFISKEYRQYLPFQKKINLNIQTTHNQYINGIFIKIDSSYLYLKSKRKTILIPRDNIQSEYRSYYVNPPTYSFGFSTFFSGDGAFILFDMKIDLLTRRRYAFGVNGKFVLNQDYVLPSIFGTLLLSQKSQLKFDLGLFISTRPTDIYSVVPEFGYRRFLGKKNRFYADTSVGYFDNYDFDLYYFYFRVGGGLQF